MAYPAGATPETYVCSECGASGVKLWRRYQTTAPDLLCVNCACRSQQKDPEFVDDRGQYPDKRYGRPADALGWYIPAVPTEDGDSYWGYTSVPDEGVAWWRALPTRPC